MNRVTVHAGHTLWEELEQQNIVIDRPCGGKGTCGGCRVQLADGKQVLACQYRTPGEVEVEVCRQTFDAVAGSSPSVKIDAQTPIAVADIGTTTVVMGVFYQGKRTECSFENPQRRFGADMMSRIQAANEGQGKKLQELIWEQLLQSLCRALRKLNCPLSLDTSCTLVVSANTTMQHLLEGLSCEGLGYAPFIPENISCRQWQADGSTIRAWQTNHSDAAEIGELRIIQLPGISAFVGADIVSGLSEMDILHRTNPQLFIDLGTNGEMALGCRDRLLVTSTAAGPAFEGSPLALRIYGAGILRLLRDLLEYGIMDEYGTLCDDYFDSGYPVKLSEYGAAAAEHEEVLVLTQEEIRQLQMAKAAVRAGVEILMDVYGICAAQIETVYLAGGFGYYLNPEDALAAGLLPKELRGRIVPVGNASYAGAVSYAAQPAERQKRMEEICRRAEPVLLPDMAGFEERYISAMNFDRGER